jgi:hypothetical protein
LRSDISISFELLVFIAGTVAFFVLVMLFSSYYSVRVILFLWVMPASVFLIQFNTMLFFLFFIFLVSFFRFFLILRLFKKSSVYFWENIQFKLVQIFLRDVILWFLSSILINDLTFNKVRLLITLGACSQQTRRGKSFLIISNLLFQLRILIDQMMILLFQRISFIS